MKGQQSGPASMFVPCSYLMYTGLIVTCILTGNSVWLLWAQRTIKVVKWRLLSLLSINVILKALTSALR